MDPLENSNFLSVQQERQQERFLLSNLILSVEQERFLLSNLILSFEQERCP